THTHTYTHTQTHTHTHTHSIQHLLILSLRESYPEKPLSCPLLHQTHATSDWIQTQHTNSTVCQRGTGGWNVEMRSSHIRIIRRDLIFGVKCCVERVCLDAATGRLSGVVMVIGAV